MSLRHTAYFVGTEAASGTSVTPIADTLTITGGTLSITTEQETRVTPVADALTITGGTLSVTQGQNTQVTPIADSLVITEGTLSITVEQETIVTPVADSLTISEGLLSVVQAGPVSVTPIADELVISEGSLAITHVVPTEVQTGARGGGAKFTAEDNRKRREQIEHIYAEIVESDLPKETKEEAGQAVKPFLKKKPGKKPTIPTVSRVNWDSVADQVVVIEKLIAIHEQQIQEDEDILLLLLAA